TRPTGCCARRWRAPCCGSTSCASGCAADEVYRWCMARTNIDIDDQACAVVMRRYHLRSKRDAVNLALRLVAGEALDLAEARGMRGSGWEGDLDEMRGDRAG